jgi:hypothetical protein
MILKDRADLMTPFHPQWREFLEALDEQLDRRTDVETGQETWQCPSDPECPLATSILERMAGVDVAESLDYLRFHGGPCDCTILMNVGPSVEAAEAGDDRPVLDCQHRDIGDPTEHPLTIVLKRSDVDRLRRIAKRLEQGMTVEMAAACVIRRWLPECQLGDEPEAY